MIEHPPLPQNALGATIYYYYLTPKQLGQLHV